MGLLTNPWDLSLGFCLISLVLEQKKVIFHDIFDVGIGANSITASLGIFECRIYL
jgi:hypothetical protein